MARMDRQLIAAFRAARSLVDVREIQPRINALRIKVKSQGHDIDVAGALAVAEQVPSTRSAPAMSANSAAATAGAAIVVRMHADDQRVALADVPQNHSIWSA
jgi:uncharacterized protein (UPF0254 family)